MRSPGCVRDHRAPKCAGGAGRLAAAARDAAILLALAVLLCVVRPAASLAAEGSAEGLVPASLSAEPLDLASSGGATGRFVQDGFGLFDGPTRQSLEARAAEMSERCNCGVYLVTVADIGSSSVREFAKGYYQREGLGLGGSKSGIMFLIAVQSRDYVTVTYGDGTRIFTDYQIGQLEDAVVGQLKSDRWEKAAQAYLDSCDEAVSFFAENGEPLDLGNRPRDFGLMAAVSPLAALALAGLVAGLLTWIPYSAMRTARRQDQAFGYVDADSPLELTERSDRYRTTTVVRVPIRQNDDSKGFGGGSFVDSSGFGGSSGGKF